MSENETSPQAPFSVSRDVERGVTVIAVEGELDLSTVPQLVRQLEVAAGDPSLIIDLDRCDFIDSTGIEVLVRACAKAAEEDRRWSLCRLRKQVQRALEITGVAEQLPMKRSRDEALAAVSSS